MRVTISHNKGQDEAKRIVDDTFTYLLSSGLPPPFRMTDTEKEWDGSSMRFSSAVRMGPLHMPLRGNVGVSDTEIAIEIALPALLEKFVPERTLRDAVESRIRGHLNAGGGS